MSTDAAWVESMPEVYDQALGPALFAPYADHVARIAADFAPARILELAAGTGLVTARLAVALPDASITATDLNASMVSWASKRVPAAEWREADAQHLDFPDRSFDLVVCQFGVMFFPDRVGAYAEAARVLTPGGNLLIAVWDSIDGSDVARAIETALAVVLPDGTPDFLSRIPYAYNDPIQIRADIEAGGFQCDGVERVVLVGHSDSAREIARGFGMGTPLRFELEKRGDLDSLVDSLGDELTKLLGGGVIEGSLAAYVATARKRP